MSNNLGSIYARTVNGTKRIIINSDSVDVSGNFFINGTNSRMPAEFENSIRNYLPLSYGTTSSNSNTLFDIISEVSNNLLTSNNDASFGNVDITGNLNINGDISAITFYGDGSNLTGISSGGGATELVATNNLVSKLDTATSLTTGTRNIILGDLAGKSISTQIDNVFIGHKAGNDAVISRGVAIGFEAGRTGMGQSAICIGQSAGRNNAGQYSIHIGFGAGNVGGNYSGCVVIVGGATTLNPDGANRCFIKPVRGVAHGIGVGVMKYDPTTSEITYSTT